MHADHGSAHEHEHVRERKCMCERKGMLKVTTLTGQIGLLLSRMHLALGQIGLLLSRMHLALGQIGLLL